MYLLIEENKVHLGEDKKDLKTGSDDGDDVDTFVVVEVNSDIQSNLNAGIDHASNPKHCKRKFYVNSIALILSY